MERRTRRRIRSRTSPRAAASAALLASLLLGVSCSGGSGAPGTTAARVAEPALERPALRLVVSTDLQGYLEPCGCTSRPLGGVDRLAAELGRLRGDGVPTVFLAAGDLWFSAGGDHHVERAGAETQEIWQAETLIDILGRLGLAAATPGGLDLRRGPDVLASLLERATFPVLGAGVELRVPGGPPSSEPSKDGGTSEANTGAERTLRLADRVMIEVGTSRVGVVGVTDMAVAGRSSAHVSVPDDLVGAAGRAAAALREQGANLVVVLARAPRRIARRIASQFADVDFVIEGGVDEAEPHLPAVTDHGVLVHAGRQGQRLVIVDVHRATGDGGWNDLGAWARQAERDRLLAQARELRARLREWEQNGSARPADLDEQRSRLADIEARADRLLAVPEVEGRTFVARLIELAPDTPRDPAITAMLEAHDRRVNEHNRVAFESWRPEPAPEGGPSYVGTEACGACHTHEIAWWRRTMHGRAYATLVERHKQYNLSCVGCHVTGYNRPGGSTVSHVGALRDVGCESCHGPGSLHIAEPGRSTGNVRRDAPEGTCLGCHTPEHSDRFVYAAYRAMMIAPGHGLPAPDER